MDTESLLARNPSAFFALFWGLLAAGLIAGASLLPIGLDVLIRVFAAPFASLFALGGWREPPRWMTGVAVLLAFVPWLYWVIFVAVFLATSEPS